MGWSPCEITGAEPEGPVPVDGDSASAAVLELVSTPRVGRVVFRKKLESTRALRGKGEPAASKDDQ